jgi:hypothetical protein
MKNHRLPYQVSRIQPRGSTISTLFLRCCPLDRSQWTEVLVAGDTVQGRERVRTVLVALEAGEVRDPTTFDADLLRNH